MVMTAQAFTTLQEALAFPLYVFERTVTGHTCDKLRIDDPEIKSFKRDRYLITGGTQCTCMSWMKIKSCKHLKMLRGQLDFFGEGVSGEYAKNEMSRIITALVEAFPEAEGIWATGDEPPEIVRAITVKCGKGPKNVEKMFYVKVFPDKQKLGVVLTFDA